MVIINKIYQFIRKSFRDYWEPVHIRAWLLEICPLLQTLAVVGMQVPQLPVVLVVLHLPQFVVDVGGAEVLRGYQVTPRNAIGDVKEVPVLAQVLTEGHVGVKECVDKVGSAKSMIDHDESKRVFVNDVRQVMRG